MPSRRQRPAYPTWLQERQAVSHAVLQQTPSVQKALAHSSALAQGEPLGRLPQSPFTHLRPFMHSRSFVHLVRHWFVVGSQLKVPQDITGPMPQTPAPSQT